MIKVYRKCTPDVSLDLRENDHGVSLYSVAADGRPTCLIAKFQDDGMYVVPFTGNLSGIRQFEGLPVVKMDRAIRSDLLHVEGDRVRLERCGNLTRQQAVVLAWGILNACQSEE
jgi:hypothetical protein